MSDPSAVSPTNNTSSAHGVMNGLQVVHDKGVGLFMGMATSVVDLVKPCVKKAGEIYDGHQKLANTGGAIVALGAWYYAPWTLLHSICCVAVPIAYYRNQADLSSGDSSPGGSVFGSRGLGGAGAPSSIPALAVAVSNPATDVSEETREEVIRLMKVFTSVFDVSMEIRDKAALIARVHALYMKDSGQKPPDTEGVTRLMTDSHFRTLVAWLVGNYCQYDNVIRTGDFNARRHDYKALANMFRAIAESTDGNLECHGSKQTHCWLINELVQGWGEPPTKDASKAAVSQLLAGDYRKVMDELKARVGNTACSDSTDRSFSNQPVRNPDK